MDRPRLCPHREPLLAWLLASACLVGAFAPSTPAQTPESSTFLFRQRILEEQLRPLIQPELRTAPVEQRFQYDYGAVLRYNGQWFEDHGPGPTFQGSRAVHDFDFRPWLSASLDGVHFGYVRGQLDFQQYNGGDSFDRNSDWRGPFVDLGFYRLDVDQAMRKYRGAEIDRWSADFSVGRQFLYVGRGFAFALNTDAVSLDWGCGDWAGLVFGSQSVRHYDNIDRTVPGFQQSDRGFFGAQIEYQRWDHHKPYGFVLVQRDHSDERPPNPYQEFDYDSEYWGMGISGEALFGRGADGLGIPNLHYFSEFIIERGDSFGDSATDSQDPIRAWALDAGLVYYGRGRSRPRYLVEYARASGDRDRRNPQNTLDGNRAGTADNGFLGFGVLNTGVSFAPLFANLEFVRAAGAFRPFREHHSRYLRDMEMGSSFFAYWRPQEGAGVSDRRADIPGEHFLGTEVDLFMNWRLSSDLFFLVNYGTFFPEADSFSVDRSRQFLGFNLTWLF